MRLAEHGEGDAEEEEYGEGELGVAHLHGMDPNPIRKISQHRQDRLSRAVTAPSPFQG